MEPRAAYRWRCSRPKKNRRSFHFVRNGLSYRFGGVVPFMRIITSALTRPLFRPVALCRRRSRRTLRWDDGADLLQFRGNQDPRATAPGWTRHRLRGLSERSCTLRDALPGFLSEKGT